MSIGLVHLVWGPLGPDVLAAFVRSYRRLDAGEPHELIVLFNGVGGRTGGEGSATAERELLLRELAGVEHRLIELDQPVLDLAAYFEAAARLPHGRLCFLNSYSEPLLAGWLGLLARAADEPNVGIVGAGGSWASHSSHVRYLIGLGGPYARLYGERTGARRTFARLHAPESRAPQDGEPASAAQARGRRRIAAAPLLLRQLGAFPGFPSPHLRTNGFLIERELMVRLRPGRLRDKSDAYELENGRRSITRQLARIGLQARVVSRDGRSYAPAQWSESHTFWQGDQENLLIADNQTRAYANADAATRRLLAAHAWGERAALPSRPERF